MAEEKKEQYRTYVFRWRIHGKFFWKRIKVVGHKWFEDQDKMVLYLTDGGIYEIPKWTNCQCYLKNDWAENAVPMRDQESPV